MKTKLLLSGILLSCAFSYSQVEQCGTMKNLEEQIKKDPSIKERMIQIEKQNQEWIEKNGRGFKKHSATELNKNSNTISKSALNTNGLCGFDNSYFRTITAPTTLNSIVSPSPNCTYGGEYVTVTNLVAGNTYRISVLTTGTNNFDTQITIYPEGGGNAVAFNDDWNGSNQSEIYFSPIFSGNYDILLNEYECLSNQKCGAIEVELWYIPRSVITIPVVVHVIHKGETVGTGTNISVAQIQSQIDALNSDFRRLNNDILLTPPPFKGASADPLIQFCLAQQKPDGTPTNGIIRRLEPTQLELTSEGVPLELQCMNQLVVESIIKPITIWDRDKYLNLWVSDLNQFPAPNGLGCGVTSELLGYAQFPGLGGISSSIPAHLTDGVWVKYSVFGTIGNIEQNYNLGRTASHEIGHWLNLKHIWGDENACAADDEVIDTPLQTEASSGCNVFPKLEPTDVGCSISYPGIMFMNHMDYSVDNCRTLFTYGQTARIDATLFNQRLSLLTSPGCIPGILGNNQFEKLNIIIYPNPTTSKVFFDNSISNFKEVSIYNYLGQEVAKSSFNSLTSNQPIDMSNLATGIYVLKFSNGETSKSVKVIKQ